MSERGDEMGGNLKRAVKVVVVICGAGKARYSALAFTKTSSTVEDWRSWCPLRLNGHFRYRL